VQPQNRDFAAFTIEIFHGQLTPNSAQVYARIADLRGGGDWTLTGKIRGPHCRHARTLPANFPFKDLGAGESLLSGALVSEPCFWSPEIPALYRVSLELKKNGSLVNLTEREIGLRLLGARGNSFYMAGKRWVLRGVYRDLVHDEPLQAWRDTETAMVVANPSEELCCETSQEGVLVVAETASDLAVQDIPTDRPMFQQWASVAFVIGTGNGRLQRHTRNAIAIVPETEPNAAAQDAQSPRILDVEQIGFENVSHIARQTPTIAMRRLRGRYSLEEARAACDLLQRDLAPHCDCAGYIV
jgi:hypothetical protein